MKYVGKCLPSLLSRLSFSATLLLSLSQPLLCSPYTQSLQTLLMRKECRRLGTAHRDFFLQVPFVSYCSPALAWVASGPQSLQWWPCPSTGDTKDAIPQECPLSPLPKHFFSGVHLFTCSQHFLFSFIFLILSPNSLLHILYHVSHFECPPVSYLHFLPPVAAILPQERKKEITCEPLFGRSFEVSWTISLHPELSGIHCEQHSTICALLPQRTPAASDSNPAFIPSAPSLADGTGTGWWGLCAASPVQNPYIE